MPPQSQSLSAPPVGARPAGDAAHRCDRHEENAMTDEIKEAVRQKYAQAAVRAGSSCCGEAACSGSAITANLYADAETGGLPEAAVLASLGCGNPTALAELAPGEAVLDLGSGGGIDVLLSARRVGPTGKV